LFSAFGRYFFVKQGNRRYQAEGESRPKRREREEKERCGGREGEGVDIAWPYL